MGPLVRDEGIPAEQGDSQMALFEGITIRKVFHENQWHFAIVDIIAALTGSDRPSKYWSDLKTKLVKDEGFSELSDKIGQLKMQAADDKFYLTDTVTVETALRIIQSIPSRKAEPFKRWLAQVGYERIQEIHDPEIAVKRAILMWQAQGRTSDWIEARLRCIVVRRDFLRILDSIYRSSSGSLLRFNMIETSSSRAYAIAIRPISGCTSMGGPFCRTGRSGYGAVSLRRS